MAQKKVGIILKLVDEAGTEVHFMNLQHPRSRLSAPLSEVVERFLRHFNRRHAEAVYAESLEALSVFGETCALEARLSDLVLGNEDIDITLRPRRPEDLSSSKADDDVLENDDPKVPLEKKEAAFFEIPPPNDVVFEKEAFDTLLREAAADTLIVLFFERWSVPNDDCLKIGPAFRRMADLFWPKALMLRADVDQTKPIVKACGVTSIPAFVFFKNGVAVDKLQGDNEISLNVKVSKWLKPAPSHKTSPKDKWGTGLLSEAKRNSSRGTTSPAAE